MFFICLCFIFAISKFDNPVKKFDVDLKISYKGLAVINTSVKCSKSINEIKMKSILQKKVNSKWENVNEWNKLEKENLISIKKTSTLNIGYTYRVISFVEVKKGNDTKMFKKVSSTKSY
ncbi:hypothetical protein JNUCC81_05480 [Faecalimicrobium sp. JNUCC 81]